MVPATTIPATDPVGIGFLLKLKMEDVTYQNILTLVRVIPGVGGRLNCSRMPSLCLNLKAWVTNMKPGN
jgi:hypothetical protein